MARRNRPRGNRKWCKEVGQGAPDGVDGEEAVTNGAFNVGVAEGARRWMDSLILQKREVTTLRVRKD